MQLSGTLVSCLVSPPSPWRCQPHQKVEAMIA